MDEYRALGLNSRGTAWAIAIVGLVLSPAIVGIPLVVWGAAADYMLNKHQKQPLKPGGRNYRGPISPVQAQSLNYDDDIAASVEAAEAERCENCGAAIGRLETPRVWKDHVVCGMCADKLARQGE